MTTVDPGIADAILVVVPVLTLVYHEVCARIDDRRGRS